MSSPVSNNRSQGAYHEFKIIFLLSFTGFQREISEGVAVQCTVFAKCVSICIFVYYTFGRALKQFKTAGMSACLADFWQHWWPRGNGASFSLPHNQSCGIAQYHPYIHLYSIQYTNLPLPRRVESQHSNFNNQLWFCKQCSSLLWKEIYVGGNIMVN